MTKREMIEQALVRVEQAQEHTMALHAMVHYLSRGGTRSVEWPHALAEQLQARELEAWNDLMMWGLVADEATRDRIKAAAHEHYLADSKSVARYVDPNGAGSWLHADEVAFREMAREAFAPKEGT